MSEIKASEIQLAPESITQIERVVVDTMTQSLRLISTHLLHQMQGVRDGADYVRDRFRFVLDEAIGRQINGRQEAENRLVSGCHALIAHVRQKYNVPDGEPLECEHMRAIEEALKAFKVERLT